MREILAAVRERGDEAVRELSERFDGARPGELRVPEAALAQSLGELDPQVREALETAIANVRAAAVAQLRDPVRVELPAGQRIEYVELPLRRAAAYVPGGRAPYPSTVVMCAATARAAGVEELAVCAPPGPGGAPDPVILAACALCEVSEVYAMGGAQAVAALAYGTESVPAVDVIVGPGNRYVQEAKRQLAGAVVGIDGVAGPSELVAAASAGADPELLALDLLAQAEHGPDGLLALVSPEAALLDAVEERVAQAGPALGGAHEAPLALVRAPDARAAVRLADELAAEHVELQGAEVEALAGEIRNAGCLFVGRDAGVAFGDYVAGSNHVLPTGGAARFASGLSPATFRRRMARVSLPAGAAAQLAPQGAVLARAEGFPAHADSMERRA
ncbi:MAG: histidinol dehydrogenase [Thermoleophilaceae bacterium]|nr:histidinol dehydrogenase [Thermoleophilaceae bacterium]